MSYQYVAFTREYQQFLVGYFHYCESFSLCVYFSGRIFRHSQQPLITYEKYNVTGTPQNVGGSRSSALLKAHGKLTERPGSILGTTLTSEQVLAGKGTVARIT